MGAKLDVGKWLLASVAVFVVFSIMQYLVQQIFLIPTFPEIFPATPSTRDPGVVTLYTYLGRAVFALVFVYVFTLGFEGKSGITEGIRYGFWIGLLIQVPALFGMLIVLNQPAGGLVGSVVTGIVQYILCGILANLLYKKPAKA
jgi:hypothetical protein